MSAGSRETQGRLGLFDAVCIIVGIIIGATIYETPPRIFGLATSPWIALGLWALGGTLAFIGALCYAELATAYPRSGGDYNYLTRAYGPLMGYLFGWAQLAVVQTGSIGLMAYIFSRYLVEFFKLMAWELPQVEVADYTFDTGMLFAAGAVVAWTLVNALGVVLSKTAQNLLTLAKVIGLLGIIVVGFVYGGAPANEVIPGEVASVTAGELVITDAAGGEKKFPIAEKTRITIGGKDVTEDEKTKQKVRNTVTSLAKEDPVKVLVARGTTEPVVQVIKTSPPSFGGLAFAMVMIFLAYGGYNDAAFVASEVRNRKRNIPLTLFIGTLLVMAIYLLVNAAYLWALGYEGATESQAIAADVLKLLPQDYREYGGKIICVLVMVSALGAVNGLIFTSSRIYATLGSDYSLFSILGRWNQGGGSPFWSLLVQMVICLAMIGMVGSSWGQENLNEAFKWLGVQPVDWSGQAGFESLLRCTAPVFWIFFLLVGMSLFILRINEPNMERPFRVPLYPLTPLIFCATCGYMLYSGLGYAQELGLVGLGLVVLGIPFYVFSRRTIPQDLPADPYRAAMPEPNRPR